MTTHPCLAVHSDPALHQSLLDRTVGWCRRPGHSGLPEQWEARVSRLPDGYASAAVMRRAPGEGAEQRGWQAALLGPDGAMAALHLGQATPSQARLEVEHALYRMGWR